MKVLSYAKINLLLEIIGKRADGFHEVSSVMQTVSLCDEIDVSFTDREGIEVHCLPEVDCDPTQNLVYRAADLFFRYLKKKPAIRIVLQKRIPFGAGLGGGSSNAAATLRVLDRLHGNVFGRHKIQEMSAQLGSDVPFFVTGGTALASGRGEKITCLPDLGVFPIVLIHPGFPIQTKHVYANHKLGLTSESRISNILPVFAAGRMSAMDLIKHVHNDLQATVMELFPKLAEMLDWIAVQGPEACCVSGSGSTLWGLFDDHDKAAEVALKAHTLFPWSALAETVAECE